MTILTAAQDAIAVLVGRRPAAVVSSTDEICVEMTAIAQDAAVEIAKAYDWQELIEFHEIVADGTSGSYPLPADYSRMVQASEMFDPNNWCWGYEHITDYSKWLYYKNRDFSFAHPGAWIIRKNEFHFLPVPEAGQKANFPYVSCNLFVSESGAPKKRITSDDDRFVLSERLLTLALIWKYKASKGLDYQQEVDDYNVALSQETNSNRGAYVIRSRRSGITRNTRSAYPWPL